LAKSPSPVPTATTATPTQIPIPIPVPLCKVLLTKPGKGGGVVTKPIDKEGR